MTGDDMRMRDFALSLARADEEKEVVRILKKWGYWDNGDAWQEYGGNSMNFSTISNQASGADHALVEKLINSVDAVLMRECGRRGIKPDGPDAPESIAEAQREFFRIPNGKLSRIDARQRSTLAENICLVATGATGRKSRPSFSIIDKGEGQTPDDVPETILSLTKDNKIRIPFVQGKFGMGGSGALRFCSSEHHLQLLISRCDPKIGSGNPAKAHWGVTVIRREDPEEGMRSSHYTYLAPKGRVLRFAAPALPLLPKSYPEALGAPLESGTYVKLYEYEIAQRTLITLDLYYRLALLMPDVALPIRMMERRKGYKGHSLENTLAGLSVRLDEDRSENLEPEFQTPGTGKMVIEGNEFDYAIYVFKKGKKANYARSEGVGFSVNGQAHGFLRKAFFERKAVGMSYLSDSILVLVDCSKISRKMQEKLFMPSRDRLAQTPFLRKIEEELESILKNHNGLKALRNRRRQEEVGNKLKDSKPLADLLTEIIQKSSALSNFLQPGKRVPNPHKPKDVGITEEFWGKEFPTFFVPAKAARKYTEETPKGCPRNRRCQVQYETDAENDYFDRDGDPGEFRLKSNGYEIRDYSLNLWNGLATLQINLPSDVEIGDLRRFETEVDDINRVEPFSNAFWIRVEKESQTNGSGGGRKKPPGEAKGKDRQKESGLALPRVREIRRDEWAEHDFYRDSALKVVDAGEENGYDFFINMDNVYLQTEMKAGGKTEPQILEERYKAGMVLLGMSLLGADAKDGAGKHNGSDPNENGLSVYDRIFEFTKAASPVLLPIASLGSLGSET